MPNLFNRRRSWVFAARLPLAFYLLAGGCSKQDTTVAITTTGFDTAPVELRDKWKAAGNYASKNNYVGCATNLMDLLGKSQQLSEEQNELLKQAWQQLGNKAFVAAERGDKMATEAVLKMRDSKIGDRSNGR